MRTLSCLGVGLLLLACGQPTRYQHNDLQLVTAYTAKDMCSCLFVNGQSEEYCLAWTRASPAVARIRVDHRRQRVSTSAAILWSAEAEFVDAKQGCVLR